MLGIENLSRTEKLRMMESLWDDLARNTFAMPSPEWHGDELKKPNLHTLRERPVLLIGKPQRKLCAIARHENRDTEPCDSR